MSDIIFNQDDRAWFTQECRPDRPLWRFFEDLQAKMMGAAIVALSPGDTDYQKGRAAGYREVLEIKEILMVPDTKDTGIERE